MQPMRPPRRMRFSWESRCRMVGLVEAGMRPGEAAAVCGASRATGYQLWARYQQGGWAALRDRPSTPRSHPRRLSGDVEREIVAIRQRTNAGPVVVAAITGHPASTVGKVLRRWGCSRLPRPERHPVRRYERARPGELLHVDTKKLGRFHVVGKADPARRRRPQSPCRLATSAHQFAVFAVEGQGASDRDERPCGSPRRRHRGDVGRRSWTRAGVSGERGCGGRFAHLSRAEAAGRDRRREEHKDHLQGLHSASTPRGCRRVR
jgi:transposase